MSAERCYHTWKITQAGQALAFNIDGQQTSKVLRVSKLLDFITRGNVSINYCETAKHAACYVLAAVGSLKNTEHASTKSNTISSDLFHNQRVHVN